MHLRSYLNQRGRGARTAFAKDANLSLSYVTDLCAGRRWPSCEIWARIVDVTQGQVTPNDHLSAPTE